MENSFQQTIRMNQLGVGNRFQNTSNMGGSELEHALLTIGMDPEEYINMIFSAGGLVDILAGLFGLKNFPNAFSSLMDLQGLSIFSHANLENFGIIPYLANSGSKNGKQSMWYKKV